MRNSLLLGNSMFLIVVVNAFVVFLFDKGTKPVAYLVLIPLIILFIFNIYFLASLSSLYFKRKKLEEEIKTQEAKNKLK